MRCPHCSGDFVVVIRVKEKEDYNVREYGCNECGKRFMSIETVKSAKKIKEEK